MPAVNECRPDMPDICDDKNTVGSNCKCSDPENFSFASKEVCKYMNKLAQDVPADYTLNAGQDCLLALVCDSTLPEGCGFLTNALGYALSNALSFGLIIICTLLKL